MTVSNIEQNRIKITLTDTEVLSCFGTYEKLFTMNSGVKSALNALLRDVINDLDKIYDECKILAKIRAEKNLGCTITLSAVNLRNFAEKEYIFDFSNTENLTNAVLFLYKQESTRNLSSSLYKMPQVFRLIVKSPKDNNCILAMKEFCDRSSNSHTQAEYTREHGKALITEYAVKKYGSAFLEKGNA